MDYREELMRQVNQLLGILKQMLKTNGSSGPLVWKDEVGNSLTLNIYFCEYVPNDEDIESLDDSEENSSENEWNSEDGDALTYELTERDVEFLKSNGLMF